MASLRTDKAGLASVSLSQKSAADIASFIFDDHRWITISNALETCVA